MNPTLRSCAQCGVPFASHPLLFEGKVLAVQRFCPDCVTRIDQSQAEDRQRRESARLAEAWERICPTLYRDTDPARLGCTPQSRAKVLSWQYGPQGLLIGGPSRTGKTRLVYLLLARLHHLERRKVTALSSTAFSHEISALFGEGGGRGEAFVNRLTRVPVLFIDDVGKGRLTERVEAEFFHVIETRTSERLPTILTTNLNGDAFAATWSADRAQPLLGRFQEFFEVTTILRAEREVTP